MHETVNFLLKLKGNSMHAEYGKIINFASIGFSFFRIVGAIVIVIGLYMVLWGRSNDQSPSGLETLC